VARVAAGTSHFSTNRRRTDDSTEALPWAILVGVSRAWFQQRAAEGATLNAAAFGADFGSYAQFHRAFQRAVGCSPRDYFSGARFAVEATTASESTPAARR